MDQPQKHKMEDGKILIGFEKNMLDIKFEHISAIKVITKDMKRGPNFKKILSSIPEHGIIEPPVVIEDKNTKGHYILLDGHLRIEALKQLGHTSVVCLISSDDESFTYNKHVNRLSPIQESRMIIRAIERGVPEEKIAKALNVDVGNIVQKRNMLNGICQEAIELLKDKIVALEVFIVLRLMKPCRQIEAAILMNNIGLYSISHARSMLAITPKDQLVSPEKPKKIKGLDEEQISRMEKETAIVQREYKIIEESYGIDVLNLTIAKGYLGSLLGNARVLKYLAQHKPEILAQFQKIAEMTSLGGGQVTT